MDRDDGPVLINGYGIPPRLPAGSLAGSARKCGCGYGGCSPRPRGRTDQLRPEPAADPGRFAASCSLGDQVCRTPWCGAPIRHADHIVPVVDGGLTSIENVQGLCENCNQVKEQEGWSLTWQRGGVIETTTPTGHRYSSHPPPLPRSEPWPAERLTWLDLSDSG